MLFWGQSDKLYATLSDIPFIIALPLNIWMFHSTKICRQWNFCDQFIQKKKNPVRLKTMFQLSSPSTIWPKFAFLFIFLLLIPSGPCSRQEIYNSWLKGWYIILYFSLLDLQLHLSSVLYSGNQESYNMLVLWWNVLTLLFIYIFTTIFSHELLYVCFSIAFQFLEFFHLLFSWQKISTLH